MRIIERIKRSPKQITALVAIAAAVITVPAALFAWGPNRPTYTIDNPADRVTFNSITNNPNIGDERNFVGIREANSSNVWYDNVKVQEGKEYYVRLYVHNNAATSLNESGKGIAKDVKAVVNLPTTTSKSIQVNGFINSSNASPQEVYDHATFTGDKDFNLSYVGGSLKYENNAGNFSLPESIFTSAGAKLGYDKMDGNIPGCFQYSGYVTFKVKPQVAKTTDFTLQKKVSKHGANQWVENYDAKPGEKVDFLLAYKNTGQVQHNNVTFRDTLPKGLTYVPGSTTWSNASKQNVKASDNITSAGINVGSYAPGANAYTVFSAKVADAKDLECGVNKLLNKGKVNADEYALEDDASVTVPKECQPGKISVCELSTKKVITIDEKDFDSTKHSKNLDDCKETPTTPETPETPSELPQTGAADVIAKFAGIVSLVSATAYYAQSRRF